MYSDGAVLGGECDFDDATEVHAGEELSDLAGQVVGIPIGYLPFEDKPVGDG